MSNVYISKALRKDIPSDAILLSQGEVIDRHWNTIKSWKPSNEVWPFRYGIGILCATSASTAFHMVHHYRNKVKLINHGRVSMLLPTTVLPTLLASIAHVHKVTNPILLGEECPLCIQTRAALINTLCAVGVPTVVSPISAFHYASIYYTYDIPPFRRENFKEIGQLWWSLVRGARVKILIATVINASLASFITYFEARSFYRCQQVLYENEDKFRRELSGDS